MGKRLTNDDIGRFRSDGVIFPVRVFSDAEIGVRREWLEAIEKSRAGRLPPSLNAKIHLLVPWLWEIVHHPTILDAVEELLGPDLLCFGTSFISKAGADGRYVTWHQDQTHWRLSAPKAVTAWLAFTPSTPENGCVRVIPGSNHLVLEHRDNGDRLNMLGRREEVIGGIDESSAVDLVLRPGEMSLHDPMIVHGSAPNRSASRRLGFAIRYIPADVAQCDGQRNSVTLVRGRDGGHFELEQAPMAPFHPDALKQHAHALRLGMAVIFGKSSRPGDGRAS